MRKLFIIAQLMGKNILKVFENEVSKKIFGLWKEEDTGEWKKKYKICLLFRSFISVRMRWAGNAEHLGEDERNVCEIWV